MYSSEKIWRHLLKWRKLFAVVADKICEYRAEGAPQELDDLKCLLINWPQRHQDQLQLLRK